MLNANDFIFWIKENRDVIVTVLFNFEANKPMITMRYIKHPTWNFKSQVIISEEINYIDVLNNMKEAIMADLKPENSVWDIYGMLKDECIECVWSKEDEDEELYCSKKSPCDIEDDYYDEE